METNHYIGPGQGGQPGRAWRKSGLGLPKALLLSLDASHS